MKPPQLLGYSNREQHMRNLAKDIVEKGEIYEPPLVLPDGADFVVYDGNRRVTCLKLLITPRKAPTIELQAFFHELKTQWLGEMPEVVQCQVETDRDRIDAILLRRHTGAQNGIGQSTWDDRMKTNFIMRTGMGTGINVADEVEKRLANANLLPARYKIPRSTLNRLLSAEALRNRVGFSVSKGKFELTHDEQIVLNALHRISDDLARKRIVLGDIWDVDGKRAYLDQLENEGVLPSAAHALQKPSTKIPPKPAAITPRPSPSPKPFQRNTLIPKINFAIVWPGRLQRHRAIWEELQFHLDLKQHPNAISVLFRVLLELSVENYIQQLTVTTIHDQDKLGKRVLKVAEDMRLKGKIDQKYLGVFQKFQQLDPLVSMDTLNRYVHSPNFAPSPDHLVALWDTLADFMVICLTA